MPQLSTSSADPGRAATTSATPRRAPGSPGAGYSTANSSLGEAVEVVDRPRPRHRRDRGGVDVPVRGDHEDRPRPRHRRAEGAPGLGVAVVLERVHRAAVPDERGGHDAGMLRGSRSSRRLCLPCRYSKFHVTIVVSHAAARRRRAATAAIVARARRRSCPRLSLPRARRGGVRAAGWSGRLPTAGCRRRPRRGRPAARGRCSATRPALRRPCRRCARRRASGSVSTPQDSVSRLRTAGSGVNARSGVRAPVPGQPARGVAGLGERDQRHRAESVRRRRSRPRRSPRPG